MSEPTIKTPDLSGYFVLATCVDRQLYIDLYPSYEAAFQSMLKDLKTLEEWNDEGWNEYYEENKDEHGCCDNHEHFEIYALSGWANADDGNNHWDWSIKPLSELIDKMGVSEIIDKI